jgi:hypothetical protein
MKINYMSPADLNLALKLPDPFRPSFLPEILSPPRQRSVPGGYAEGTCSYCHVQYHWCVTCQTGRNTPEWIPVVGYCSERCLSQDFEGAKFISFEDFARHLGISLSP